MKSTENMTITMTRHACKMAAQKGFGPDLIAETFIDPERVYPSGSHPGQYRVTGNGLCLVGTPQGGKFVVITCYADKVLTAPRPDQMDTPEGRRYAERFAAGQGRG